VVVELFYEKDIVILKENDEILVTSYGALEDRIVTNAVSYTMYAYSIFYRLINEKEYIKNKILKMYNFILSVQRENGSWFYAPYDSDSFIDCFYSVFVLKNIVKTQKNIDFLLSQNEISVKQGYEYIKNNLYDTKCGLFRRFSIANKTS
jgi:hypothetical protein